MSYSDFLGYLLSVAFRLLKRKIENMFLQYELTAPQWGVLSRLYEQDGLTLVEISNRLFSKPSTIKLIIDKLETKGFIKKQIHENDKRASRVFLTENAKLLEKPLKELILKEIDKNLINFNNKEKELFKDFLKKLIKNLTGETTINIINNYKLTLFPPPCFPGAIFWSAKIDIDTNLTDLLPYLNGYLNKKIYQPKTKTIVFNFENHKISVRPNEVKVGNIKDKEEGEEIAKRVIEFINEIWQKRDSITPDFEKKEPPKVIDIYKILPKTNCGKCGKPSCFVFAAKLSQGNADFVDCPEIDFKKRDELNKLFFGK